MENKYHIYSVYLKKKRKKKKNMRFLINLRIFAVTFSY